jgi:hypothetical protein
MIPPDSALLTICDFCWATVTELCPHEPPTCDPCCRHLSHDDPRDTLNGVMAWGVRVGE